MRLTCKGSFWVDECNVVACIRFLGTGPPSPPPLFCSRPELGQPASKSSQPTIKSALFPLLQLNCGSIGYPKCRELSTSRRTLPQPNNQSHRPQMGQRIQLASARGHQRPTSSSRSLPKNKKIPSTIYHSLLRHNFLFALFILLAFLLPGPTFPVEATFSWPRARIPFEDDPRLTADPDMAVALNNARMDLQVRTCIRLVPRRGEQDYAYFSELGPNIECWNMFEPFPPKGRILVNAGSSCLEPMRRPHRPKRVFSECDIEYVNHLYNCPKRRKPSPICPAGRLIMARPSELQARSSSSTTASSVFSEGTTSATSGDPLDGFGPEGSDLRERPLPLEGLGEEDGLGIGDSLTASSSTPGSTSPAFSLEETTQTEVPFEELGGSSSTVEPTVEELSQLLTSSSGHTLPELAIETTSQQETEPPITTIQWTTTTAAEEEAEQTDGHNTIEEEKETTTMEQEQLETTTEERTTTTTTQMKTTTEMPTTTQTTTTSTTMTTTTTSTTSTTTEQTTVATTLLPVEETTATDSDVTTASGGEEPSTAMPWTPQTTNFLTTTLPPMAPTTAERHGEGGWSSSAVPDEPPPPVVTARSETRHPYPMMMTLITTTTTTTIAPPTPDWVRSVEESFRVGERLNSGEGAEAGWRPLSTALPGAGLGSSSSTDSTPRTGPPEPVPIPPESRGSSSQENSGEQGRPGGGGQGPGRPPPFPPSPDGGQQPGGGQRPFTVVGVIELPPGAAISIHEKTKVTKLVERTKYIGPCGSACTYAGQLVRLYRSFNSNPQVMDHFYTTERLEQHLMASQGFLMEPSMGFLGRNQIDSNCSCIRPLYRLYSAFAKDHFLTSNDQEKGVAETLLGYTFERILGYCTKEPGCGAYLPLYRFFNAISKDHFYTVDQQEMHYYKSHTELAYGFEKIECYVWQHSSSAKGCPALTLDFDDERRPAADEERERDDELSRRQL